MGIYTITAEDTFTLYDRVLTDFADADASTITFPNDLVAMKTGKNQNTIFSKNETGNNASAILRMMRGSPDDRFLRNKLAEVQGDFASVQLAAGQFVKRLGDGQGNVVLDVYTLTGGIFTRKIDTKENVEGDTDQGVAIYNMMFAIAAASIQ